MGNRAKLYFMPKSEKGKVYFWLTVCGIVLVYLQYWIAMLFNISILPAIGLISFILLVVSGIMSLVTILKRKEYAISLFISSLLGLLGIIFILGELLFSS